MCMKFTQTSDVLCMTNERLNYSFFNGKMPCFPTQRISDEELDHSSADPSYFFSNYSHINLCGTR
jgi:hypothetical protein